MGESRVDIIRRMMDDAGIDVRPWWLRSVADHLGAERFHATLSKADLVRLRREIRERMYISAMGTDFTACGFGQQELGLVRVGVDEVDAEPFGVYGPVMVLRLARGDVPATRIPAFAIFNGWKREQGAVVAVWSVDAAQERWYYPVPCEATRSPEALQDEETDR